MTERQKLIAYKQAVQSAKNKLKQMLGIEDMNAHLKGKPDMPDPDAESIEHASSNGRILVTPDIAVPGNLSA